MALKLKELTFKSIILYQEYGRNLCATIQNFSEFYSQNIHRFQKLNTRHVNLHRITFLGTGG